jgi:hypothetical protein
MSEHKIYAEIEIILGDEAYYPTVEIKYNFTKGSPAVMYQRNGDPGWPEEPAEVEATDAKLLEGDGLTPTQEQVWQWAQDWIGNKGYQFACEHALDEYY